MAYRDLEKRTKILRDKAFEIASNLKYDSYQRGLASIVYKILDKKFSGSGVTSNKQLENEIHKPIIRTFKKRKVYLSFKGIDLADMQQFSKYNKETKYLLCAIVRFSKYAWVDPLTDKNGITIINTFQRILGS